MSHQLAAPRLIGRSWWFSAHRVSKFLSWDALGPRLVLKSDAGGPKVWVGLGSMVGIMIWFDNHQDVVLTSLAGVTLDFRRMKINGTPI